MDRFLLSILGRRGRRGMGHGEYFIANAVSVINLAQTFHHFQNYY